ncbi:hypothetical protein EV360DRAFT_80851 [Lentinula raphanica]|nr:hypothetical protein EV360DRAFT_80851 [Lentinula raphanica]
MEPPAHHHAAVAEKLTSTAAGAENSSGANTSSSVTNDDNVKVTKEIPSLDAHPITTLTSLIAPASTIAGPAESLNAFATSISSISPSKYLLPLVPLKLPLLLLRLPLLGAPIPTAPGLSIANAFTHDDSEDINSGMPTLEGGPNRNPCNPEQASQAPESASVSNVSATQQASKQSAPTSSSSSSKSEQGWILSIKEKLLGAKFMDRAPGWKDTINLWFEFESLYGPFSKWGKGLPTTSHPTVAVGNWIKSYRIERTENIPKGVGKAEEFGSEGEPSPNGTFYHSGCEEGEWEDPQVQGSNGFLSILECMLWWQQRTGEEKIIDDRWFVLKEDVDWVLRK